ncbi:Uma2 family endonuclease [Nostoc sp. FACHB-87]|uniref:Uma2 family endonuclease n=1 Tax=Nostocaceae TaxID=1162 RepID=UPI0016838EBF|nr:MULTISPECIES: Uma2 family endonuclease [Nostocaceae]MBD2454408.1 Uma2 family endonuclease [Nostoc sp. FACHB-87]MBD2474406.1 Uma2 family endonuclease [Anabaena sp. FACHB-83]
MTISSNQLKTEIFYPDSDGKPMAESDPARDYLIYAVEALDIYFQARSDIYVSGNLYIYYKQGIPSAVIAPDVFVVFGVEKKKRSSYKVWQEGGKVPNFVLEITSASTQENDEEDKPQKYAFLGVQEYFQYDPTGDYLKPQLKGSRLVKGKYQSLTPNFLPDGVLSIHSEVLGLDLRLINGELRFFDPQTGQKLLSHKETEQARQQAEQARRDAIPKLLDLGLNVEQIASALNLPIDEVTRLMS